MARKPSAKVVLNRANLDKLRRAWAEGVEEIVHTFVEVAEPPDAAPFGQGLVTQGGWLVYVDGKKVGGGSLEGTQPKKPRAAQTSKGIVGVAGFGFPGRFQNEGTVNMAPNPFATRALMQTVAVAPDVFKEIVGPLVRRG